ncbi:MAG: T9SS type A sorting domain-containing protein [Winogradskyella sp.]|nr:T9SS type A sorting domain-containing protein [Winogradskyella sp.]
MKKNYLAALIAAIFVLSNMSFAQQSLNYWNNASATDLTGSQWQRDSNPTKAAYFQLNFDAIAEGLSNAHDRKNATIDQGILLNLPYADGSLQTYQVLKASIMHEELQEAHPSIQSYIGRNTKRPSEIVRFSITSKGFSAIILNSPLGTQYIDGVTKDRQYYMAYAISDITDLEGEFTCLTEEQEFIDEFSRQNVSYRNADDGQLREFRLALACTQEYSEYHIDQAGLQTATDTEKKDYILGVMVGIMTRVNAVFENDMSVTMTLIPNNTSIIFLQDNFLTNNSPSVLINESQQNIDSRIGNNNYDIGHMLCTAGSGLAATPSVCSTSNKARAISGTFNIPEGLVHENIIRHEMGHQYGAFHTYNADDCANPATASTAYEPGGGTTVMSYAGICASASNIINTNDLYFHQISLDQMWFNITFGGITCAVATPSGNTAPIAEAGPNYIIPIGTPYKLVGVSTDDDGIGTHTYCWEQYDLGPSQSGPPSNISTEGPLVRSFPPNTSNIRYVPKLSDVVEFDGNSTQWEVLTLQERSITYKLTVRDNDTRGGQIAVDDMAISTLQTGFFRVTSQNSPDIVYDGGTTQTVTWNVAGTTGSGIDTANVRILLSTDAGVTFDTVLLESTPNDGSADVTIPNVDAADCRIIVEAVGNIFFNINSQPFAIQANLSVEDNELSNALSIYPNPSSGTFTVSISKFISNSPIEVEVYDLRGRIIFNNKYEINTSFNQTIDLEAQSGLYLVKLTQDSLVATKKLIIE